MPSYQRILLVAVLTVIFVAAGVGGVRFYLSPIAEQATRQPERPDETSDDLSAACLDELAALENPPARGQNAGGSSLAASDAPGTGHRNPLRPQADLAKSNPDEVPARGRADGIAQTPAEPPRGSDAMARPIAAAQSAEWNAPAGQPSAPAHSGQSPHVATLPVSVEENLPTGGSFDPLKAADVLDVMRRLRSDTESERALARRELARRGFSEVDLELARQLFSPDAEARKQLAQSVPRLASVDAARWLMWLAADPQPAVRRAAITTLATTGDPALLDRVEALARKDSDEQIQALADQIAKQRDLSTSRGATGPLR